MLNLLYVRFPNSFSGGVKSYSSMMIKILSFFAKDQIHIIDLAEYLENNHRRLDLNSSDDMKSILANPDIAKLIQNIDLAIADVGLMEHRELIFIHELKKIYTRIKTVITLHDPPLEPINLVAFFEPYQDLITIKVIRKIYNFLIGKSRAREMIRSVDGIVTLSKKGLEITKSDVISGYDENIKQFVFRHPNIMDFDLTKNLPLRSDDSIVIGYYGFITKAKGVHILLEALRGLIRDNSSVELNINVLIAGRPNTFSDLAYYNGLIEYANKYEMARNVRFLGYLSDQGTISFFESLDLLVLPYKKSRSMSASGPLTLARSFGVPVLASNTSIFVEYINCGEDGLVFNTVEGSDGLLKQIRAFLDKNELRLKLRHGSAHRAAESSWSKSAATFSNILKQI
jgi:glycosyltransferase involved in cell wall biosynthesis